jgi:3-deoxy-D-manno-octulosonate 8-phosphate phosphatase KdsC-like HAD superfamily phosphatase
MLNPERVFRDLGGQFVASPQQLVEKISKIKVFLFDWDGVFNAGYKGEGATSLYSETDSMGTNLMRFGKYLQNGKIPFTAIITGEQNESAFKLARREHFNAVFFKVKNKRLALSYLGKVQGIKPEEVCFFFDDVLDMAIAKEVGLRVMIHRNSSPLFTGFVREKINLRIISLPIAVHKMGSGKLQKLSCPSPRSLIAHWMNALIIPIIISNTFTCAMRNQPVSLRKRTIR